MATNSNPNNDATEKLVNSMLKLNVPVMIVPSSNNTSGTHGSTYTESSYCTSGNYNTYTHSDIYSDLQPNMLTSRQPPQDTIAEQRKFIILYKDEVDTDFKTYRLNNLPGFRSKHQFKRVFKGCTATVNKGLLAQLIDDPDILIIESDTIMHQTGYSTTIIDDSSSKNEEVTIESHANTSKQTSFWHQNITSTQPTTADDFSSVHCYILDTGILSSHSEFSSTQVMMDYNAINRSTRAQDDHGHGTGVASMVAGKTVGIANKTVLHSIKVLDSSGTGYTSDIISGLNWILENAKMPCVINMSIGGNFSSSLNTAVQTCINRGIQVVCAAGNEGKDANTLSPANNIGAITVAAHDILKSKPSWSNFGSVIDTFAPGVSVRGAWGISNTSYYLLNGTSFASPIVAGIICRYLKENQEAKPTDIQSFLSRINLSNEITNTGSVTTPNLRIRWDTVRVNPCQYTT